MEKPLESRPDFCPPCAAEGVAMIGEAAAPDSTSTAEYIARMSAELADLAGAARLDMLAYFLDMARLEAESHYLGRK
jgi:hypothetical protein